MGSGASNNRAAVGAAAAAAVVGTLVVGPMVGVACAAGALYATTRFALSLSLVS